MALRSLATRMRSPAASALRQWPGPATAAAAATPSRFLSTTPHQVGNGTRRNGVREFALATLRDAKKHEESLRREIKVCTRVAKVLWWTYKLGVTAYAGVFIMVVANKVDELSVDGPDR
ncbi:unnamed protein product [Urochloa humidicola]